MDDQIGHAKLCSLDLLDLHENVRDALLYDLFFISRIVFVEHEGELLDLRQLFELRDCVEQPCHLLTRIQSLLKSHLYPAIVAVAQVQGDLMSRVRLHHFQRYNL